jgi:hypothetical protein
VDAGGADDPEAADDHGLEAIYKKPVLNLATGNLWTRDEVLTAVVNRGYSLNDATSLIETWNA